MAMLNRKKGLSPKSKMVLGEFFGSAFISFWGLGFIIPFAVLGYVTNMFEFALWFGLCFAITVIIFAPISCVHVNPAVTVAWVVFGGFDKKLIIPYWMAQILGWGVGTIPIYLIFDNVLADMVGEGGSALFYCATPAKYFVAGAGLEICMTALLVFGIFIMLDGRMPNHPSKELFPWAIGGIISIAIAMGGGFTGACINPARDFGPRLSAMVYGLIKGYDVSRIFAGWQWLMYIIAPMLGAVLGGLCYNGVVKLLPSEDKNEKAK